MAHASLRLPQFVLEGQEAKAARGHLPSSRTQQYRLMMGFLIWAGRPFSKDTRHPFSLFSGKRAWPDQQVARLIPLCLVWPHGQVLANEAETAVAQLLQEASQEGRGVAAYPPPFLPAGPGVRRRALCSPSGPRGGAPRMAE